MQVITRYGVATRVTFGMRFNRDGADAGRRRPGILECQASLNARSTCRTDTVVSITTCGPASRRRFVALDGCTVTRSPLPRRTPRRTRPAATSPVSASVLLIAEVLRAQTHRLVNENPNERDGGEDPAGTRLQERWCPGRSRHQLAGATSARSPIEAATLGRAN